MALIILTSHLEHVQNFYVQRGGRRLDENIIAMESYDVVIESKEFTEEVTESNDPKPKSGSFKV